MSIIIKYMVRFQGRKGTHNNTYALYLVIVYPLMMEFDDIVESKDKYILTSVCIITKFDLHCRAILQ
jgi:hypothetical protein